eukprot:CAMPEP_0115343712 /NCGR_PEP_ID=MMETSP0270-20121206/92882_1 /TAXON_ID=71861 /ORGANISM="Scrippsiella trochoidea, Strain CCMP3099" /LENGTH=112 /DNA_ID=CAMNT_0002765363 /DNA_START=875 /DNA_END=1210 /DNA_ORIENTATION=+
MAVTGLGNFLVAHLSCNGVAFWIEIFACMPADLGHFVQGCGVSVMVKPRIDIFMLVCNSFADATMVADAGIVHAPAFCIEGVVGLRGFDEAMVSPSQMMQTRASANFSQRMA